MKLVKENIPFTMVANEVLKDARLSFKAKGMYAYLFSKPDEWDFSSNRMILETTDRRDAIMGMLQELEENGYLVRQRLSNGKMEYTLKHSLSREIQLRVEKPKSGNPTVGKSLRGKIQPISNIEEKIISKEENNTDSGVPPQEITDFIYSFKEVNPSYENIFKNKTERKSAVYLIKKYGLEKVLKITEQLPKIIIQPYAPRITTPYELERNLGKLLAFIGQSKIISTKKETKII
jgi:hypothetical protein